MPVPRRPDESEERVSGVTAERVAWIALLLCLAALVVSQQGSLGFQPGHHGYLTSMGLSLAKNLSPENRFLMFTRVSIDEQGNTVFSPHNRFPVLSYVLIKGAMSLAGGDLDAQMRWAHQLMNLFFWGGLVCSYLLVRQMSGKPLLAIAVSVISYSSSYMQYYNDMVFNDIPALFGFLLVLLGVVSWRQTGSARLLYLGIFVAIALGWQAYAVLVCWATLEALSTVKRLGRDPRVAATTMLRHPATRALAVGVLWGGSLLSFNLYNESRVMHQDIGDLPTARSIRFRLGLAGGPADFPSYEELRWRPFLEMQVRRILKAAVPTRPLHGLLDKFSDRVQGRGGLSLEGLVILPAVVFFWSFWRLFRGSGDRLVLFTVLLSGLFWTIPMKYFTAFHDFQGIFYVGIVLVIYLALLHRLPEKALGPVVGVVLAIFVYANADLNLQKAEGSQYFAAYTRDFAKIDALIGKGRRIQAGADDQEFEQESVQLRFYMAGDYYSDARHAEFVLSKNRAHNEFLMTPDDEAVFLFRNPGGRPLQTAE